MTLTVSRTRPVPKPTPRKRPRRAAGPNGTLGTRYAIVETVGADDPCKPQDFPDSVGDKAAARALLHEREQAYRTEGCRIQFVGTDGSFRAFRRDGFKAEVRMVEVVA